VTSQYRKERLQDTPISESAMSAEELARRNVTDLSSLAGTVPGFFIGAANATQRHESDFDSRHLRIGCHQRLTVVGGLSRWGVSPAAPRGPSLVLTTSSASRS
jgi:hypothetical protein